MTLLSKGFKELEVDDLEQYGLSRADKLVGDWGLTQLSWKKNKKGVRKWCRECARQIVENSQLSEEDLFSIEA
eukprot:CAMPEP_0201284446 /NCGR_PEP_ID=MMETSP1317-20130820/74447_1 /ASSEMBLY_ACC=CAM_ASM_000770 /TAXON_ID=187299 /ORGANISM="Undescribed Undescribed, Strain Undescribed" /LENGTH=72 /DNA_ID=CAMNT_0047604655 /DNA_START=1877 /DNA_END=2095 /DNA_ORIENTATION=+